MSPNSQNIINPIPPVLDVLRRDIDWIDDQILDLLEQRYAVVKRVAWAKTRDGDQALAIRPEREASILDRLTARAIHVPLGDVTQIWRSILSLSAHHQRAYRVLAVGPESARLALLTLAAARYGEGITAQWTNDREAALVHALRGEAVVLVATDDNRTSEFADLDLIGQHPTGCIEHPWALELGRLDRDGQGIRPWSPTSWKGKVHHQLPAYPDPRLAAEAEAELAGCGAIVALDEVEHLQSLVAEAQSGHRVLIQAGDCAESITASSEEVTAMAALVGTLGDQLEALSSLPAIRLGRMGGQWAKPRSQATEGDGEARLATYRGDAVNGAAACPGERTADPHRLLLAREQARRVNGWLGGSRVHTSHEGLLLNYEAALTRSARGRNWAGSAHSLWLGERTRDPSGAHVEYLRGIANPLGIKCGPRMTPEQLLALLDRLDPQRVPGRIMLVARLGRDLIEQRLPLLIAAVAQAGCPVLWLCDPMHGNNHAANGTKVRLVPDIIAEAEAFARITRRMGIHAGGLHLEVTPRPVLECVDRIEEATTDRPFDSLCDPRLNAGQAARVVAAYASALGCAA
ncbi:3-deoxy-7-phosphoheptulonate synthase [Sphingomonas humi]|uniref:Phospho-2-dehydro-3-deoxyheptonate aldolase n=1 Tax=Sphingomonas humi TaxID=335630 RepID=A0ABP7RCP0_9SPHN